MSPIRGGGGRPPPSKKSQKKCKTYYACPENLFLVKNFSVFSPLVLSTGSYEIIMKKKFIFVP